jgi:pyruvate-formate lyase-activating enzyme
MGEQVVRYISGWYPEERGEFLAFRWMRKEAEVEISAAGARRNKRFLVLVAGHAFPNGPNPVLKLRADGKALGEEEIRPAKNMYLFPLRFRKASVHLELRLDRVFKSTQEGDHRELGICVYRIATPSLKSPPPPTLMELETTTICDINPPCVMCYTRMLHTREGKEGRNLDETAFDKIAPHLRGFEVISLHGIGEPLAGKELFSILKSIDSSKTKVQFNSNGLNLSEEKSRELVKNGLSLINFSVDAATAETYQKIRRVNFHRVIGNIRRLSEIKKEMAARRPVIEMNMTLMRSNFEEAGQFVYLAKDLGAEGVSFGVLNRHFEDYTVKNGDFVFQYQKEIIGLSSAAFREKIREAREAARALGINLSVNIPGA